MRCEDLETGQEVVRLIGQGDGRFAVEGNVHLRQRYPTAVYGVTPKSCVTGKPALIAVKAYQNIPARRHQAAAASCARSSRRPAWPAPTHFRARWRRPPQAAS